jgi:tRNA A37 methylthiotransferase MiaB
MEVLVEGTGKRGLSTQSRTRTNRIVHLPTDHEAGSFLDVRITAAAPHHLLGEVATTAVAV